MATSLMATPTTLSAFQEQVDRARAAFHSLPRDNTLLQQCLADQITLEGVFAQLQQKSTSHKRKLSTRTLDRFHRCTGWMLNISRSIDVAVNASAGIGCPVWAPIKFILMLSQDDSMALEEIISMIHSIADNLPRLDLYERFRDESCFQAVLVELFADIVDFASQVYQFLSRRTFARLASLTKRNFKDRFGRTMLDIERRTRTVDNTAIALHQVRTERLLQESKAKSRIDDRIRLMQWLNSPNIQECYERTFSAVVDTTCEWFLDHPLFFAWADQRSKPTESRVLIVHGGAGSGKSVLSSFVYHVLRTRPNGYTSAHIALAELPATYTIAFFAFSTGDLTRQSQASLVRSILSQILESDISEETMRLVDKLALKASVSTAELQDTLRNACLALSRPIIMVIDGIDEHSGTCDELLKNMLEFASAVPNLHLILLGQSHAFAKFLISTSSLLSISLVPELTHKDMEAVVKIGVLQSGSFWDDSIRKAVAEAILNEADGMFLYARLMLNYLKGIPSEAEIYECLQDLPSGLEKTYELLLDRLSGRLDGHQYTTVSRIFSIIACSGRSLTLEELRLAYALVSEPQSELAPHLTERYLLKLSPEEIVELCGGILTFNDGRFQTVHSTARTHLTDIDQEQHLKGNRKRKALQVQRISAHNLLSTVCEKVIRCANRAKEDETIARACWEPLLSYAKLYLAHHLNNGSKSMEELFEDLNLITVSAMDAASLASMLVDDSMSGIFLEHMILFDNAISNTEQNFERKPFHEAIALFEEQLQANSEHETSGVVDANLDQHSRNSPDLETSGVRESFEQVTEYLRHTNSETNVVSHLLSRDMKTPAQTRSSLHPAQVGADTRSRFKSIGHRVDADWARRYRVIYGSKFAIALGFVHRFRLGRLPLDPLHIAWDRIKAVAKSASPLISSALTFYLMRMNRYEEALEMGNVCYQRLKNQRSIFRTAHEMMMGTLAYLCYEDAQAIFYFECFLKDVDRYPLLRSRPNVLSCQLQLAESYESAGQYSRSLDILRPMHNSGSYKTLNKNNTEIFYTLLGTLEHQYGDSAVGFTFLCKFRDLCYENYTNLKQEHDNVCQGLELSDTLRYIAEINYESGNYADALQILQESKDLLRCSRWTFRRYDQDFYDGYEALILYKSHLEKGYEELLCRVRESCDSSERFACQRCCATLDALYGAASFAAPFYPQSLRHMLDDCLQNLKIYELTHTLHGSDLTSPCLERIYIYRWRLSRDTQDRETACAAGWACVDFFERSCHFANTAEKIERNHEQISVLLCDLAKLEEMNGRHLLAVECARTASHILLQHPLREEDVKRKVNIYESLGSLLDIPLTRSLDTSEATTTRLSSLERFQVHLDRSIIYQAYRTVDALIDVESWVIVQSKYLKGQQSLTLEERAVEERVVKFLDNRCGIIVQRYYNDSEGQQVHQCLNDECCSFRCDKWDYEPISLSYREFSPILLESIGLIFGPHIPSLGFRGMASMEGTVL